MRKLGIVIFVFLLIFFTAPVFAQEADYGKRLEKLENAIGSWNLYGSIRMQTMWQDQTGTTIGFMGATPSGGDRELKFDLQDNNRIGGTVTRGNLTGGFEFGLDDADPNFKLRIIYGKWTFDNGIGIMIGQHYTPSVVGISNSTSVDDGNFFWSAPAYNGRRPQMTLSYGALRVGFVKQHAAYSVNNAPADADIDTNIPKIEGIYTFSGKLGFIALQGGYQTYKIESNSLNKDFDVNAYFGGVTGQLKLGPAALAGSVWAGQNAAAYGLTTAGTYTGANKTAIAIEGDSVKNSKALGAIAVATFKANQALSFEAGVGYIRETSDRAAPYTADDETLGYYLQSVVKVTKFLRFVPEVGYFDYKSDLRGRDQGKMWYAGIQTRIDF